MYAAPYIFLRWLRQKAIDARRADRTWKYFLWSAFAGLAGGVMIAIGTLFTLACAYAGWWWLALGGAAVFVMPVLAPWVLRHLAVPLGGYRAAYALGLWSRPGSDSSSFALCAAAWAARSGAGAAWIARRRDLRKPLGDADVCATALVAAARGDLATARMLLRSVPMLVENHPSVRDLCGEWLAVDAAERGAWSELAADARVARWPASPLTYLLEGVAARMLGEDGAPAARELWGRWLLAPHRRTTRALVAAALVARPAPVIATAAAVVDDAPSAPLPRAVASLLAFDAAPPTPAALADAVRAWDAALADGATHAWLARRALELDAPHGAVERALRDVAAAVTEDLARAAEAATLGAPASHGAVGGALGRRLRHGRLDALETGFTRWGARRHDGEAHAAIDEWREFLALHAAYAAAVTAGGLELRRLAFPHAFSTGSSMAAWLWNTRKEYALSHAISRWLLAEALAVGDAEAIELGHRNCALPIPTRLGDVRE